MQTVIFPSLLDRSRLYIPSFKCPALTSSSPLALNLFLFTWIINVLKELPSPIISASLKHSLTHSNLTYTCIIGIHLLLLRSPLTSVLLHSSNLILLTCSAMVDVADHAWSTPLSGGLYGATPDFSQENRNLSSLSHIWRFFYLLCFVLIKWIGREDIAEANLRNCYRRSSQQHQIECFWFFLCRGDLPYPV